MHLGPPGAGLIEQARYPAHGEPAPLCRIEYLGDDEDWGFAIYDPATETYTPALLHTGQPTGHPSDAFDTAAIIHLADYQQ